MGRERDQSKGTTRTLTEKGKHTKPPLTTEQCYQLVGRSSAGSPRIIAGLVVAGMFIVIAAICAIFFVLVRRRVRERAIYERAARANSPSWLLDQKILATALQTRRALGLQRIVPIVLLGFNGRVNIARAAQRRRKLTGVHKDEVLSLQWKNR